jgi:uncharacterized membrane protein
MNTKLALVKIISIGNNWIGTIAGLLGALGLINLFTGSNWGLGSRGRSSGAVSLTASEDVFIAISIVVIAIIYYLSIERIRDSEKLSGLFYLVLDKSFKKISIGLTLICALLISIFGIEESIPAALFIGLLISMTSIIHVIVISTSFFTSLIQYVAFSGNSSSNHSNIERKLDDLNSLYSKGLITEEEFNQKRSEIINRF